MVTLAALTPFRFCALLLLLEASYAVYSELRAGKSNSFLIGDCPYYAATADSLIQDGDWDIRNQLPGDLADHEGFFALSRDNRIVPKHSTLLPLLSLPFRLLLGVKGFLVFNLLQVFATVLGIALLAARSPAGRLLALVGYLSTPFLAYTYNYSPDVLGTALVVWCFLCALGRRPIACGILAGLAIWAKVYLALVLLPVALLIVPIGWRATLTCALAAALALAPMLAINAHLFGAPWITGYDRDARITADGFAVTEHYSRFNQPIVTGLGNLLFDGGIGMLRTAPLWFLWPLGVWFALRRKIGMRLALAMAAAIAINLLIFAHYDEWNASFFGNRFLFPALALGVALQGPFWASRLPGGTAPADTPSGDEGSLISGPRSGVAAQAGETSKADPAPA